MLPNRPCDHPWRIPLLRGTLCLACGRFLLLLLLPLLLTAAGCGSLQPPDEHDPTLASWPRGATVPWREHSVSLPEGVAPGSPRAARIAEALDEHLAGLDGEPLDPGLSVGVLDADRIPYPPEPNLALWGYWRLRPDGSRWILLIAGAEDSLPGALHEFRHDQLGHGGHDAELLWRATDERGYGIAARILERRRR